MAEEKKFKVKVISGSSGKNHLGQEEAKGLLNFSGVIYEHGDVLEVTESEMKEGMRDGNFVAAPSGAKVSIGRVQHLDAVERDLREKRFDEAKSGGAIHTPPATSDPRGPMHGIPADATSGVERLPGDAVVNPLGDHNVPTRGPK